MSKTYDVTVAVAFNGHRITRTSTVDAASPKVAKELAEDMAGIDIEISSGTPREKEVR